MKRWQSGHEIDNVFGAKRSCFVHVLCMFSSFTSSEGRFTCEATMESEMQVQVEIGDTRRVFFMAPPKTVDELNNAITSNIPKMRFLTFGILYENDEGEYVVLNNDAISLRIAISTSKLIVGTDIQRLKLRVFEGSSPSVKAKPVERAEPSSQSSSTEGRPSARVSLNRDILNYVDGGGQDSTTTTEIIETRTNQHEKSSLCSERTPLERYIIKTEERIEQKRSQIQQLREKVHETEMKLERVKSDPRDGNICRNCHLRLGHSARTCVYGKCSSVFKCGEEKFHPGELNVKEMRCEIKRHQSELNRLFEELESKKSAVERMKDKVQNRIESDLFEVNKAAYLVNGTKHWSLLRKHVYLVEEYCKKNFRGKIPGKQDIRNILEKALTDNNSGSLAFSRSKQGGSRKRENPAKPSLERYGVEFPSSKHACNSSSDGAISSQILYTAPRNKGEEAEQLAMVIRESLREQSTSENSVNTSYSYDFLPPPHPAVFPSGVHFPVAVGAMGQSLTSKYSMQYPPDPCNTCTATCTTSTNSTKTVEFNRSISTKQESSDACEYEAASLLLNLSGTRHSGN